MNKFLLWFMSMQQASQSAKNSPLSKWRLTPFVATIVFILDWVLFSAETPTMFATWPVSVAVGIVLVFWAAWRQRRAGDTLKVAWIKGLGLGVLTAIPTPIASLFVGLSFVSSLMDLASNSEEKAEDEKEKPTDEEGLPPMRNVTPKRRIED